ncbi:protein-L-isoaspartate(D-aspartate) O-methyltransferase [Crenobacter luteus]|uniref:Protein-L-isoaspartate O-methyltransferase n=1 Tax=Crenobacter luteus TaxID=1452487 RepID=A0A163BT36_9NEIS|nr:protein-L-isoaspartate O-methyltransferase [Crenobacter luteus]KZE28863.1 protein-L-isoaspartate O-methyltransferase [Crenobacter luteus]TCP11437.1 protein-L-isoaspartate(D-aspartate) O-methyltransferase [Crenobacter luteus]
MDFEKARFNMVEQQIRPWDVLDAKVLDLLFAVKREDFVQPEQRDIAFADVQLPLPNGSLMLEPKVEARLVQDLDIKPTDRILEVGTGSGYVTALLARLGKEVVSVEIDPAQKARAAANLKKAGVDNVTLLDGNGIDGVPGKAPFDAILVGGSLPVVPEALKQQLAVGGRLAVIVGDEPVMRAIVVTRTGENAFGQTVSFDTVVPRLAKACALAPAAFSF